MQSVRTSILIPTRGRRKGLLNAVRSARETASSPEDLEFIAYVDNDDWQNYLEISDTLQLERTGRLQLTVSGIRFRIGPRIVLSNMWNKCAEIATGDLFMQGNDDILFRTRGWDDMVRNEFDKVPDKVLMVHGSDGSTGYASSAGGFGPHPFVHRRWFETLGYVTHPCYSSDYGDTVINDLSSALGRRRHVPIVIEHLHYVFGKAQVDVTTQDRLARHSRDRVEQLYSDLEFLRQRDVEKLKAVMKA